jgi:hypothetical protein
MRKTLLLGAAGLASSERGIEKRENSMKSIGFGVAALVVATGASAYPMDIENNARWLVLDSLPQRTHGTWDIEVTQLRTRDWAKNDTDIAAVCGTLDGKNADDGVTNFVIFYARNDQGVIGPVGGPLFYGTLSDANPQQSVARTACGEAGPATTVEESR